MEWGPGWCQHSPALPRLRARIQVQRASLRAQFNQRRLRSRHTIGYTGPACCNSAHDIPLDDIDDIQLEESNVAEP